MMSNEATYLADTLIFTLGVITRCKSKDRKRIATAYLEAQLFVATIDFENGSARSRIVACLERFKVYQAADDVASAGWMLTALQQRISEEELPEWEKLKAIADKAVELLPLQRRQLH